MCCNDAAASAAEEMPATDEAFLPADITAPLPFSCREAGMEAVVTCSRKTLPVETGVLS